LHVIKDGQTGVATFDIKTGKRVFHGCKRERLVFSEVREKKGEKRK
jgi:hypothetical protein